MDSTLDPDAFEKVLEYLYTATIVATRKDVDEIIEVASKIGVAQVNQRF